MLFGAYSESTYDFSLAINLFITLFIYCVFFVVCFFVVVVGGTGYSIMISPCRSIPLTTFLVPTTLP